MAKLTNGDDAGNLADPFGTAPFEDYLFAGHAPAATGNVLALLAGSQWTGVDTASGRTVITYSFADPQTSQYSYSDFPATLGAFSEANKQTTRDVLKTIESVCNVVFVEVPDDDTECGVVRYGYSNRPSELGYAGYAFFPSTAPIGGDVWIATSQAGAQWDFYRADLLLHETLHAIGLKHSFEGGAVVPTAQDIIPNTVMSYSPVAGGSSGSMANYPREPMVLDIAAVQALYGAANTNSGSTVYDLSSAAFQNFKAVWDAGGVDLFDATNLGKAVTLDLNAGAWSNIGYSVHATATSDAGVLTTDYKFTLSIALGTVIENANGSALGDVLIGNAANNDLKGLGGNDSLDGGDGDDTLSGGAGDDTLAGGTGNDTLDGGAGNDRYIYNGGGAADRIIDSGGVDRIVFGAGADPAGITATRATGTVTLLATGGHSITFDDLGSGTYAVEQFEFTDTGSVLGAAWINAFFSQSPATGSVTVSGSAVQKQVLTANTSSIADPDGLGTFSYQWLANGVAIGSATAASFTLTEAQVGKKVSARVSFTDGKGHAESLTSAESAAVANVNDPVTGIVTIGGSATQNQVLSAVTSNLSDPDGFGTLKYEWLQGTTKISGATSSTYTLTQNDVQKAISVRVFYTDLHGTAESVTSGATALVANVNDAPTGGVSIGGTGGPGQTLNANTSSLKDADGLGQLSYQWLRGATAITGATGASYILKSADEGQNLSLRVSYTDGFGKQETVTSASLLTGKTINGTSGANTLADTAGADKISAAGGNDYVNVSAGNDSVDGGSGIDVVAYGSSRSAYTVSINSSTLATSVRGPSADGSDSLTTVERLKFSDVALALDLNGNAGIVAKIVGVTLGGAAGVANTSYIGTGLDLVDGGYTAGQLVDYIANAALGVGHSHAAFVQMIWNSLYGAPASAADEAYWVGQINSGAYTEASLGVSAGDDAQNTSNINLTGLAQTGLAYLY